MLGEALEACAGPGLSITLNEIARDRATGGFTLSIEGVSDQTDDYVRFGTAIGHLLGSSNHDSMSGTYFARFFVKDTDSSDSYLRQAYRPLTLHTDGTFVSEATEWLLMMKFGEANAIGGESRFLHIDDWDERSRFLDHPLGRHPFHYKAPGSKNVDEDVERPASDLDGLPVELEAPLTRVQAERAEGEVIAQHGYRAAIPPNTTSINDSTYASDNFTSVPSYGSKSR